MNDVNDAQKSRVLRVLHLEDNENDQLLVQEMLRTEGIVCDTVSVKTENDFESALQKNHFDLIISDFSLPSCNALFALDLARKLRPQTPFIFFSGTIGEDVAVETLKKGATDYVLKQRPGRLVAAIKNALRSVEEHARVERMEREMRQLEEQLLRAQRLESLGALVGGIAHDLNNALVPIVIGVELLQRESLSPDGRSMAGAMETSVRRSAEMVRQMLLFARGGEADKSAIEPAQLVREISRIISKTFPKSIHCRVQAGRSAAVMGVATQLHQVLLNFCVNARDAMPNGGTLTLSTDVAKVDAAEALRNGVEPGPFMYIAVTDTGEGIPAAVQEKIFQPFFTTKPPGKGTGLGLSTCRSIVKSHGGFITVRSAVGEGSEFRVWLPMTSDKPQAATVKTIAPPSGNGERILVVDDEETILAIARAALQNFGYKVLIATSGVEAISLFTKHPDVALVISDLAMPFMDGKTTVAELRKLRPDIRIVIASGTEKELEETLPHIKADGFVVKPFASHELLEMVHRVLASTPVP